MGKKSKKSKKSFFQQQDDTPDLQEKRFVPERSPECPFLSEVISLEIGSLPKVFNVHVDILAEIPRLYARIHKPQPGVYDYSYESIDRPSQPNSFPEIDSKHFELVLCYLYRGRYEDYYSSDNAKPAPEDLETSNLERNTWLYCFAEKYAMPGLEAHATERIRSSEAVDYRSTFEIAKEVYADLDDQSWYRSWFKERSKREFVKATPFKEAWFLAPFELGNRKLSVDLFTTFVEASSRPTSEATTSSSDETILTEQTSTLEIAPAVEAYSLVEGCAVEDLPSAECTAADYPEEVCVAAEYAVADCPVEEHPAAEAAPEELPLEEEASSFEQPPISERLTAPAEYLSEEEILGFDPCPLRRHHMAKFSRWRNCETCLEEIQTMARASR